MEHCGSIRAPLTAAADLRRLMSNVGSSVQRSMRHHTAIPFNIATAMAHSQVSQYHIRAYGDELSEKIAFDNAEIEQLERRHAADTKVFKDRIAANQEELRKLFGRPVEPDMPSSSSQPTLSVKRAKLAAVRSVGVQTD